MGKFNTSDDVVGNDPFAIEVKDLHKSFGSLEVLKGVNLEARKGDIVAIIGGSGSGKSTMLRCINFLEQPTSGEIVVAGETIKTKLDGSPADHKQIERIRTRLSMVFQSFNLWSNRTLLENIIEVPIHVLKVPRADAIKNARELLNRVGLSDKEDTYPLFASGGQQQRAAIARALAVNPDVMLFDEPTSALDPELVGEVLQVIKDLAAEGRTMIIVTHEMSFARDVASKVLFLDEGQIEEQGSPKKVLGNPKSGRLKKFLQSVK